MSVRALLGCCVVLAVAGGCGSDDEGDAKSSTPKNPPLTARVEMTKDGYRPKHLRIRVGGEVTFVNMDRDSWHTAETGPQPDTLDDSNEFDTHVLTWGEPFKVTLHKPGWVRYHSALDRGWEGTIDVVVRQ